MVFLDLHLRGIWEKQSIDYYVIGRDNYNDFVGRKFDIIINANGNSKKFLATQKPREEFLETVASVQRSLLDFGFTTYVLCSTVDVYNDLGNPALNSEDARVDVSSISKYGLHKLLAEELVRNYSMSWLIFRFGGFVGPGLKKNSVYDLLNNVPLRVNVDSAYQYLPTDFAASAVFKILSMGVENQIFNLCGNGVVSLREVCSMVGWGDQVSYFDENPPLETYEVNIGKIKRIVEVPDSRHSVFDFVTLSRQVS